jgi:type I restriction enzyme R subunit
MKNHTLMQTIARANRVFPQKLNGLIVDYVGVFRDLQKALAIYGSSTDGSIDEGDTPIKDKEALIIELRNAIAETIEFCRQRGIDLARIQSAPPLEKVKLLEEAVESILINDESKKKFIALAIMVNKLYKSILHDERADEFISARTLFLVLLESIKSLTPSADISEVMEDIEKLLDRSIAAEGYVIDARKPLDLGKIDFDKLRKLFEKNRKRTTTEQLKSSIESKLNQMVTANRTRMDFLVKFQKMIDEYNSGAYNIEVFFEKLVNFARELGEEDQRAIRENLAEEELVVFDLLTKPELQLNKKETEEVKKVAKDLLDTLKNEKLILDWRKKQQSRASVRLAIETVLDRLPRTYTKELYQQKCDVIYQHVYDSYFGQDSSIFAHA